MQTMNNVCQFSRHAVAPSPVVFVSPALRPFAVSLYFNGERHVLNVLAFKSCDAICSAVELFFDGEYEMPDGMKIDAQPANVLPRAA